MASRPIEILPQHKSGPYKTHDLFVKYQTILDVIGFEPNTIDLDDPKKVKASWGFTADGADCAIWCYKHRGSAKSCLEWSFFGPKDIKERLFKTEQTVTSTD